MRWRLPLRLRVTLGLPLVGALVAGGVGTGAYYFTITMEHRLVEETLDAELGDYIQRRRIEPAAPPPASTVLKTWVLTEGAEGPPALIHLKPGLHRVRMDGRSWFARVRREGAERFIVLLDDAQIRHREAQLRSFLLLGGFLTVVVAGVLGWWIAGRVIAPVRLLAEQVSELQPDRPLDREAIPKADDEVERLYEAFADYQLRLIGFIARERAFTGDASHELRTPLSVIRGAAEVLQASPDLDPSQQRPLERITRAVLEMERLIEALLALAREEGAMMTGQSCRLDRITEHLVEQLRPLLKHKPVTVDCRTGEAVTVEGDCSLLTVVVGNLIRNAFSYTSRGRVLVAVDSQGVRVRDTGPGIPAELRENIFERYARGQRTDGAGIGLSLAKRICERNGWSLELQSEEGQGTEVRLFVRNRSNHTVLLAMNLAP